VTAGKTSNKTDPTFFVFDIADPNNPSLVDKIDNDLIVLAGLNSVVVSREYAFVASASSYTRGQMQVVDLSSMSVKTFKVPIINPAGSSKGVGNSIFYKNGIIYLGLTKSDSENEFNIIDVLNPQTPFQRGSYSIGNAVNTIVVRNNFAYIASPNSDKELVVLSVNDPVNPIEEESYNAPAGGTASGNGKSLYLVGNNLYFGRTVIHGKPEFYILNNTDSTKIQTNNPDPTTQEVNISVDALVVRDYLAFLLTKTQLQIWKIDHTTSPWSITSYALPIILPASGSFPEPSMDCEANRLYISSNNSTGQGSIYIIKPGT